MVSYIAFAVLLSLAYGGGLIVYRLFFHPLAKFPGPKLPACSLWYEFYYDVILRGQLIWKIEEWHKKYGPIIRINPYELHIDDKSYLDDIYGSQTRIRNKYDWWVTLTGCPGSVFSTAPHDLHRIRRSALNPFFSKKAVTDLESLIQDKISKLANRFDHASQTGEVVRAEVAFSALTMDIICQYTFAIDENYLGLDDYKLEWKECLTAAFESAHAVRQFPWLTRLMEILPKPIVAVVSPEFVLLNDWRDWVESVANKVLDNKEETMTISTMNGKKSRRTIFHELRDGDLPAQEKDMQRLLDEVQILGAAGSETTAQTLSYITYYLLANPDKLERLRNELKTVLPRATDTASHIVIEQLPYVAAVISEGLRLSFGITTRNPRLAPNEALKYKQWVIPPNTPVSSTAYFTLMDPSIFPQPHKFMPERWLSADGTASRSGLNRYLLNFGRGSRSCLGINLAYAELYLTTALLFRQFDFELYETSADDVILKHDLFVAAPKLDSKGIRIKVAGRVKE